MRIGLNICASAFILTGVIICSAPAFAADAGDAGANTSQSSGNVATANGKVSASSQPGDGAPFVLNAGTLAESANTTALSTSTYHQSTGILPGIK